MNKGCQRSVNLFAFEQQKKSWRLCWVEDAVTMPPWTVKEIKSQKNVLWSQTHQSITDSYSDICLYVISVNLDTIMYHQSVHLSPLKTTIPYYECPPTQLIPVAISLSQKSNPPSHDRKQTAHFSQTCELYIDRLKWESPEFSKTLKNPSQSIASGKGNLFRWPRNIKLP